MNIDDPVTAWRWLKVREATAREQRSACALGGPPCAGTNRCLACLERSAEDMVTDDALEALKPAGVTG